METRQITQGHIYFIVLNNMYAPAENKEIVAMSDDVDRLISFYQANLLPADQRFRDESGMYRSFMRGVLYDYNPPMSEDIYESIIDDWFPLDEIDIARSKICFV